MDISKIRNWLLRNKVLHSFPPVVGRAFRTYLDIRMESAREPKHWPVRISFFFLTVAVAGEIAFKAGIESALVGAILTALSVLAGFLITLILFTGNNSNIDRLPHNVAKEVSENIRFMIRFQLYTFIIYLTTIFFGLIWFVIPWDTGRTILAVPLLTGTMYSLLRSIALPLQLYELHDYRLAQIVSQKKKEAQQAWLEKNNNLIRKDSEY